MALENNLQLISYLAAAEIYDQSKNIYECFLPIIESAIMCNDTQNKISFLGLQNKLKGIYHLDVPKSTLKKLLEILQSQHKINFVSGKTIIPYKDELNTIFWEKRNERENAIEDFFIAFNTFLVNKEIDIPLIQLKDECCKWLYIHSLELAAFINKGTLDNNFENDNWEYSNELVLFLLDIQNKKSEHFNTFLLLYNGAVQSSLLNFETKQINNICNDSIQLKNIILDTNFILRILDLQSEFDCSIATETLSALKTEGARFFVLEQTLNETQTSIKNFLDESQPYTSYTNKYFRNSKIRMVGFLEATRRGVTRTSLFEISKKDNLKSSIKELVDVTFIDDFDDTQIEIERINSLVQSKNRDTYGEKQARHDLCLIDYCRKKRKKHSSKVTDIDWWVLTNDEKLTYWNQQNCFEYQECLTEIQLSNLIWIQQKKTDNLGLMQTIVSLSSSTSISFNDVELFAHKIQSYQEKYKNNKVSLDKLSLVFASNMLTTADVQKINAEEDTFEYLEKKVIDIQMEQSLKQQQYELVKDQGTKLSNENEILAKKVDALTIQLEHEKDKQKIDKYQRDIFDIIKNIEYISYKLDIYTKLDKYEDEHDKSTGRYVILIALFQLRL